MMVRWIGPEDNPQSLFRRCSNCGYEHYADPLEVQWLEKIGHPSQNACPPCRQMVAVCIDNLKQDLQTGRST